MTMLPEVEKFFTDLETVDTASREAYRAVYDNNPIPQWGDSDRQGTYERRDAAEAEVATRERAGIAKAVDALKAAGNPLVNWILDEAWTRGGYRTEAKTALQVLTVDGDHLAELDAASYEHDWCNVYLGFRASIIEAGLVVETNPKRSQIFRTLVREGYSVPQANRWLDELDREITERVVMTADATA